MLLKQQYQHRGQQQSQKQHHHQQQQQQKNQNQHQHYNDHTSCKRIVFIVQSQVCERHALVTITKNIRNRQCHIAPNVSNINQFEMFQISTNLKCFKYQPILNVSTINKF